jgi:NADP-dependent 3-hydroxy acid dehydrogenase YdfG/Flp pilus assembly protein TadD
MSGSLQLLQRKKEDILPLIIDGFDKSEPEKVIQTQFERVSDIIQYINFWQEQYLDLRRQKRQLDLDSEEAFHKYLRDVRSISGEAGEFLRLLRNMTFYRVEEFSQNNYQALFRFLGKEAEWQSASEIPTMPAQEGSASAGADPEIIPQIPGIDLLPEEQPNPEPRPEPEPVPQPDPVERKARIDQLIASGQQEEAIRMLDESLAEDPQSAGFLFQKALLLSRMENARIPDALQTLDQLLQVRPVHLEGRFLRAELKEQESDYVGARHDYERVLDLDPDHPTASLRLGILLAKHFRNEPLEAARVLQVAIRKDPQNAEAHYQYTLLLKNQLRQLESSLPQFEKAISLNPDNAFARLDLAYTLKELGREEDAFESYQIALELAPNLRTEKKDQYFFVEPKPGSVMPEQPESAASGEELPTPQQEETQEFSPEEEPRTSFSENNGIERYDTPPEEEDGTAPEPLQSQGLQSELTAADEADRYPEDAAAPEVDMPVEEPEEDNTINALKDNLQKLELLLAERRRREKEALEAHMASQTDKQTVLITGASSGIGRATARKFAENGYRIIVTGRRSDRLMAMKEEFSEEYENTDVYPLPFDVRDLGSIQLALNRLPDEWKKVDILINNAGKAKGLDPIHQGNIDHWNEMIDTNLKGLLYLTRAISPGMVERRKGHIINVGSIAGKEVYPKGGVYCATKFGVEALTQAMRLDFHAYGIRVGQVSPGHVEETEFALVRFDGDGQKARIYEDFQPLRASDVAEAIFFMATQPPHVNVQDILLMGTQQASATIIDRSGRSPS